MRYIFLFSLILVGCQQEEVSPEVQCLDCDKVVSFSKFNLPGGSSFGDYTTQNECTGVTKTGTWNTSNGDAQPVTGECY